MKFRPRSFSVLYGIQRSFLNIFYLISAVAIFWLLFWLLQDLLGFGGAVIIPVSILYLVLVIVAYSMIQVISYIPANLPGAFDPIKNSIADRSVSTGSALASQLADFLCAFFDFSFFDVQSSAVLLEGSKAAYCNRDRIADLDLDKAGSFISEFEDTKLYIRTEKNSFIYIVPLIFGENRLGFMLVETRQKLRPMFVNLLNEFENDFVDDQVVHVLANESSSIK